MTPSIATAVIYFIGRKTHAAIIVQNFMGIFGVIASLTALGSFRQPMLPIYVLTGVSVVSLVVSVSWILRRVARRIASRVKKERDEKEKGLSKKQKSAA